MAGESFAPPTGPGSELTGMGSHHPAEYFLESILTPDAVLVDGPEYVGPDGRSVMPSYPDLTLRQLADLEAWFRDEGARGYLAHEGLVHVDTWVDATRDEPSLITVLGFRDFTTLRRFLDDPSADPLGRKFDDFIGTHEHLVLRRPPLYRVATLSAP